MQEVIDWFFRTHEVTTDGLTGGGTWRLRWLPQTGGPECQQHWLMTAIEHCRRVANQILAERRANDQDDLRRFHDFHEAGDTERSHRVH